MANGIRKRAKKAARKTGEAVGKMEAALQSSRLGRKARDLMEELDRKLSTGKGRNIDKIIDDLDAVEQQRGAPRPEPVPQPAPTPTPAPRPILDRPPSIPIEGTVLG